MQYAAVPLVTDMQTVQQAVQPAGRGVGIVLFEGFSLPDMSMVAELFDLASRLDAAGVSRSPYAVRVLSVDGGRIASSSSLQVQTEALDECFGEHFDAVFVFGATGAANAARDERLLRWLHAAPSVGAVVRPLTHADAFSETRRDLWAMPQNAEAAHTTMVVDATRTQMEDRDEPVRRALAFVAHDLGLPVAREVAGQLLPDASARLLAMATTGELSAADKIRRSAQWLRENCERPISVADAAQEAAMSERNFLRRFKLEMCCTPSEYLLQARLAMTRRLLAATELPVDKIARRCGMGNGDNLAKMFRKRWSISPTEYRLRHRRERHVVVEHQPGRSTVERAVASLAG